MRFRAGRRGLFFPTAALQQVGGGGGGGALAFTPSINPATYKYYNATAFSTRTFTAVPMNAGYNVIFLYIDSVSGAPNKGVFIGTTPATCLGYAGQSVPLNVEAWGFPWSGGATSDITVTTYGGTMNAVAIAGGYLTGSANIHVASQSVQHRTYGDFSLPAFTPPANGAGLIGALVQADADYAESWSANLAAVYGHYINPGYNGGADALLARATLLGSSLTPVIGGSFSGDTYTGALLLGLSGDAPATPAGGWNQMLRGAPFTHGGQNGSWSNNTVRCFIPAGQIAVTGSQVRVTVKSPAGNNMVISKAYIQKAAKTAGAMLTAFSTTPVQMLSGGLAGKTVAANASHTFDATTFAVTRLDDLIVTFHFTTATNLLKSDVLGSYRTHYKSGDEAALVAIADDYGIEEGSRDMPHVITGIEAFT